MQERHFKSSPFYKQSNLNVDRENSLIKNIVIAQHGLNKNGSYFNDEFLSALVVQGNEQTNGVKSRFGHPNMCASSLGTFLGRYKNFSLKDQKVYANLELDETAKDSPSGDLYTYVLNMADKNPDMFGNSIVVGCEAFEEVVGEETFESLKLESFIASDIVDDPAATDSLFENSSDMGIAMTNFLDTNQEVFEVVKKNPKILTEFFERYGNYHTNKYKTEIDMTWLEKLKGKKEKFDVDVTLADGMVVTVVTESETPQVGDSVIGEDGNPVADAGHVDADGNVITTVGGVIESIEAAEEVSEEASEEVSESADPIVESLSAVNDKIVAFTKTVSEFTELMEKQSTSFATLTEDIEVIAQGVMDNKESFETLAKNVKSEFDVTDEGEAKGTKTKQTKNNSIEALRERKQQLKNK